MALLPAQIDLLGNYNDKGLEELSEQHGDKKSQRLINAEINRRSRNRRRFERTGSPVPQDTEPDTELPEGTPAAPTGDIGGERDDDAAIPTEDEQAERIVRREPVQLPQSNIQDLFSQYQLTHLYEESVRLTGEYRDIERQRQLALDDAENRPQVLGAITKEQSRLERAFNDRLNFKRGQIDMVNNTLGVRQQIVDQIIGFEQQQFDNQIRRRQQVEDEFNSAFQRRHAALQLEDAREGRRLTLQQQQMDTDRNLYEQLMHAVVGGVEVGTTVEEVRNAKPGIIRSLETIAQRMFGDSYLEVLNSNIAMSLQPEYKGTKFETKSLKTGLFGVWYNQDTGEVRTERLVSIPLATSENTSYLATSSIAGSKAVHEGIKTKNAQLKTILKDRAEYRDSDDYAQIPIQVADILDGQQLKIISGRIDDLIDRTNKADYDDAIAIVKDVIADTNISVVQNLIQTYNIPEGVARKLVSNYAFLASRDPVELASSKVASSMPTLLLKYADYDIDTAIIGGDTTQLRILNADGTVSIPIYKPFG